MQQVQFNVQRVDPSNQGNPGNVTPGSKHVFGSPGRTGANIHNMHQQQPPAGNDFFSKFGQGGSGAPMRDQYGNVISTRKPATGQVGYQPVDQSYVR